MSFNPDLDDLLQDDAGLSTIRLTLHDLLRRSTVLYGDSNSGKSTIIYEMFHILRRHIPIFIVISPTAASNGDFNDRVPTPLIFKAPTKELLKGIYERQEAATVFFNKANNIETLESLYKKISSGKINNIIRSIKGKFKIAIQHEMHRLRGNDSLIEARVEELKETYNETLINTYRVAIRERKGELEKRNLNSAERHCLKYLDFNPNLGLILDDCAAQIKAWGKDETIGKVFYQGRHNFITSIYTFQHDKLLDTAFRQNAFVSIFTTAKSTRAFFSRASNNFDKDEIKKVTRYIKSVFIPSKTYQKFVYLKESKKPYNKYQASTYKKFMVCFPYIQKYCELIESNEEILDEDNPFMKSFLS